MTLASLPNLRPTPRFGQIHRVQPEDDSLKPASFEFQGSTYWVTNGPNKHNDDKETFLDIQGKYLEAKVNHDALVAKIAEVGGKGVHPCQSNPETQNDALVRKAKTALIIAQSQFETLKHLFASRVNPDIEPPDFD
jgi:hypothetical protein